MTKLAAWPLTKNADPKGMAPDYPLALGRIAITIAATVLTWHCHVNSAGKYSNVMASSALTLIASMCFDRRLGQAAFCGTFAGMSDATIVPHWKAALWLGLIPLQHLKY